MRMKRRKGAITSNVDMTPMLDVVFQLILFFLVSTTFAVLPGIKLNLPESSTAEGTAGKGITIYASIDGKYYFNDKEVTMEQLSVELDDFDTGSTAKDEFPVSIEADSEVTNGSIVHLFDVLRDSGYSVINLRTASEK